MIFSKILTVFKIMSVIRYMNHRVYFVVMFVVFKRNFGENVRRMTTKPIIILCFFKEGVL